MESRTIGDRIREIRAARGWTVQKVADVTGYHKSYISKLECGQAVNPSSKFMVALSLKAGVDLGWLLTGSGTSILPPGSALHAPGRGLDEVISEELAVSECLRLLAEQVGVPGLMRWGAAINDLPIMSPTAKEFWSRAIARVLMGRDESDESLASAHARRKAK